MRLILLPLAMSLMWLFYNNVGVNRIIKLISDSILKEIVIPFKDDAHGFFSKNGLILNIIGLSYGCGILVTITLCEFYYFVLAVKKIFLNAFPST